jgi:hypothetical protein
MCNMPPAGRKEVQNECSVLGCSHLSSRPQASLPTSGLFARGVQEYPFFNGLI